jgi:DNA-binding NarL/FixJ family response regulator
MANATLHPPIAAGADAPRLPIRVVLVEDDVHFQSQVIQSVQAAGDMTLAGVATSRAEGLRLLKGQAPDVLLVDLGLPDGSGIDVIRAALAAWPDCGVMVCTALGDEAHVMKSIEAGASGYLLKDSSPENMLDEIRSLNAGGSPISPLIARQILTRFRGARPPGAPQKDVAQGIAAQGAAAQREPAQGGASLSGREREVLELITKGFTAEEIADLMDVSRHTVLTYIRRIYGKLKVSSKAEAIYEARQQGILAA